MSYGMSDDGEGSTCVYCGHPVAIHGTVTVGCADCACGMDPDWHGDE